MNKTNTILNILYNYIQESALIFGLLVIMQPIATSKAQQLLWFAIALTMVGLKNGYRVYKRRKVLA